MLLLFSRPALPIALAVIYIYIYELSLFFLFFFLAVADVEEVQGVLESLRIR